MLVSATLSHQSHEFMNVFSSTYTWTVAPSVQLRSACRFEKENNKPKRIKHSQRQRSNHAAHENNLGNVNTHSQTPTLNL